MRRLRLAQVAQRLGGTHSGGGRLGEAPGRLNGSSGGSGLLKRDATWM